jgi:D-beta-D-heptose 7-phosphate kinase/D-beta-D-heptose 1-phosphate adenosyltransferase
MLFARSLLVEICHALRSQDKRVVFTNGCFDILHAGHVRYLAAAKALGDVVVVGLNSDASVRRLKGASRPINSEQDRAAVLAALKSVDYVCMFGDDEAEADTPLALIQALQPDVLVKGGDYTPETIVGADIVKQRGGQVIVLPFVEGKSTSTVVERIRRH